jgi:hypothetical protein
MGDRYNNHQRRPTAWVIGLLTTCLFWGMASASLSQNHPTTSANVLGGPSAFMAETKYDFGEVNEGAQISHEFIVENKGNADLSITKVSPD